MPSHVDFLKADLIPFCHFQNVNIHFVGSGGGGQKLEELWVNVLLNTQRIIEGSHHGFEFVEGGEAKMLGSVEEGINLGKPGLYFLLVVEIFCHEGSLPLEGCSISHELVGGWIDRGVPWEYLSPLTTLSAIRISSVLFLLWAFIFLTSYFSPLMI